MILITPQFLVLVAFGFFKSFGVFHYFMTWLIGSAVSAPAIIKHIEKGLDKKDRERLAKHARKPDHKVYWFTDAHGRTKTLLSPIAPGPTPKYPSRKKIIKRSFDDDGDVVDDQNLDELGHETTFADAVITSMPTGGSLEEEDEEEYDDVDEAGDEQPQQTPYVIIRTSTWTA